MRDKTGYNKQKKWDLKASVTVEASLSVPLFFIMVFSFFYEFNVLFEVNKNHIQLADAAADYSVYGTKTDTLKSIFGDSHIIMWSENEGYKICFMRYKMKNPVLSGRFTNHRIYQRIVLSDYKGKSMCSDAEESERTVYITESGSVYHEYSDCTYLNPSIQRVSVKIIDKKRNSSGEKYKKCEFCYRTEDGLNTYVYITTYGDRYHCTKKCHGIKRYVRKVKISEIGGMPECSKCKGRG